MPWVVLLAVGLLAALVLVVLWAERRTGVAQRRASHRTLSVVELYDAVDDGSRGDER